MSIQQALFRHVNIFRFVSVVLIFVAANASLQTIATAAILSNPIITAGSNAYNGVAFNVNINATGYAAQNIFDNKFGADDTSYSSNTQGAGTALSTTVTNGTWLQFDFGATVPINGWQHANRNDFADTIDSSRLYFSADATFDGADPVVTINHTNQTNILQDYTFALQTARYVRWEVATESLNSNNLGAVEMRFDTPTPATVLPNPTIIGGTNAFGGASFNDDTGGWAASRVFDGNLSTEYASASQGVNTYLDFDFGSPTAIGGFRDVQRTAGIDNILTANLIFASDPGFSNVIATRNLTLNLGANGVETIFAFPSVTAQYVRWQATSVNTANNNAGARELQFFAPVVVPEPSSLAILLSGSAGMFFLRKRGRQASIGKLNI